MTLKGKKNKHIFGGDFYENNQSRTNHKRGFCAILSVLYHGQAAGLCTVRRASQLLSRQNQCGQHAQSGIFADYCEKARKDDYNSAGISHNHMGNDSAGLRKMLCKRYLTELDKAKITGISLI